MHKLKVINLDTVGSTNDYAWELGLKGETEITAVLAREQTAGKGRLDRTWASPGDKGLYMSLLLRPKNLSCIPFFNFLAAYACILGLKEIISLKIKWPNDLFFADKKIGGILLKSRSKGSAVDFLVLGLGLNVNSKKKDIPEEASSLYLLKEKQFGIRDIFDKIIKEFLILYKRYEQGEEENILAEIRPFMLTLGKKVRAEIKGRSLEGRAVSFDAQGALFIRQDDRKIIKLLPQEIIHLR